MSSLKAKMAQLVPKKRDEVRSIIADFGDHKLSEVSVAQAYGGMRGVKCMVTETSALDAQEGIRFRGYSIPDLQRLLPRGAGDDSPLPEGLFYLLLTGEIPTAEEAAEVSAIWRANETLPPHVAATLDAMPADAHPMTQLSVGLMALQTDSIFASRYAAGMAKDELWEAMFDDSMLLLGRLPTLAAYIYRRSFRAGEHVDALPSDVDWAANLSYMLLGERNDGFQSLLRLYVTILADHEGGNVSAHTTHLVGSALSDPYLCLSAGLNGLAGPLHGLASQEVMRWINSMKGELGGGVPTTEAVREYIWDTLNSGRVVPGYGHGVLRATDPRYMAQRDFAQRHLPDDENVRIVSMLYDIVPEVLREHGKAKNPWPNVDAHTGVLFVHYGLTEPTYYTVLFGVSRAMGVLASLIWDRALGLPLERPKSVTTEWIKQQVVKA